MNALPRAAGHAQNIIGRARAAGVSAKVIGGVGCWFHSSEHSADAESFARNYGDVDLVLGRKEALAVSQVLEDLGYQPVSSFNSVQGEARLMFVDVEQNLRIDIFVGAFEMCHNIPLGEEAFHPAEHPALGLVELLLTKLQIVKCNEKDFMDIGALLAFHAIGDGPDDIDGERFARILARDWGLWRTVTDNLAKVEGWAAKAPARSREIVERAQEMRALVDAAPKSRRWKTRSMVGDKVRWYEEPEEPETETEPEIR
ncbi:MAG: hypothetical protein U0R52_04275 [Solirubrobacterales bacterium]